MVGALLASLALAGFVECDPTEAANLVIEARIEPNRAPVSHPELIPGLALASEHVEPRARAAIQELCAAGSLSLDPSDQWADAGWTVRAFVLRSVQKRGCALHDRGVALWVVAREGQAPRYGLRGTLPETRTPIGACDTTPSWRQEEVLGGEGTSARLVVQSVIDDGQVRESAVVVREASPEGWRESVVVAPAPDSLLGQGDGPRMTITETGGELLVVAWADRHTVDGACQAVPGQTVWRRREGAWAPVTGREAVALLAERGLWRLTGQEGWLVILTLADEDEMELLRTRTERLERNVGKPVIVLHSAQFPELNPGFTIATLHPFATKDEATTALKRFRGFRGFRVLRARRAYVKRAWTPEDPCAD